jgi:hypothetical protein
MIRKVLPFRNFPHRLFSIVAIIALVAFLLTIKPVAETVKKLVEMLGITFPPMDIFKNAAANILLVCLGYFALVIAAAIAIPIVKIAVTVSAVAVVGYGLYNLYKVFTGGTVINILPEKGPKQSPAPSPKPSPAPSPKPAPKTNQSLEDRGYVSVPLDRY